MAFLIIIIGMTKEKPVENESVSQHERVLGRLKSVSESKVHAVYEA
jgi:hypothetical protein